MSPNVHVVVRGFRALDEFQGFNDCCGPNGEEVNLACVQNRAPTGAHMNEIRARDIQKGWFRPGGGNTLHEVWLDATEIEHVQVTETPFGSPLETIRENLENALRQGNPCVLQLQDATMLPHNEHGVLEHFIACGGIDTNLGVLVANGDEIPFTGTYWVAWDQIAAARPGGVLEFHMPAPPPTPAPPTPTPGNAYIVKAGDSLSSIAAAKYGNAAQWPLIWQANHIAIGSNPNLIRVGMVLIIPPAPTTPAPAHRTWKVRVGDSLSGIAQAEYNNAARWPDIWRANMTIIGSNPNLIKPGEVLAIP